MGKIGNKYLEVSPFKLVEKGFHKDEYQVSESLFSLSNEYMGIRGFFEEGYDNKGLRGSYFNGIYDYAKEYQEGGYKGVVNRTHFMVNSVDYFKMKIVVDNEELDLNKIEIFNFIRELSFLSGVLHREFDWKLKNGKLVHISFDRFLSLINCHNAFQRFSIKTEESCNVEVSFIINNKLKQWGKDYYFNNLENNFIDGQAYSLNETLFTKQKIISLMSIDTKFKPAIEKDDSHIMMKYSYNSNKNEQQTFIRYVTNLTSREYGLDSNNLINNCRKENKEIFELGYIKEEEKNKEFFKDVYERSDINIIGNDEDLQGIRYCIFMLNTTYHGYSPFNNIGAKGLTGEAYSGHAFWDSETYCLPYYLFNNINAAKNMILFRYNELGKAKERAKMLDCNGACFPIATLNGEEGCTLWQHASLQFQPSTGVAYAIFNYYNFTHDQEFIYQYGYELLLEIGKFLLDRGQYNNDKSKFGYYCVMGPDEFKMMVNNNTYTNIMAKFTFELILNFKKSFDNSKLDIIEKKCNINNDFYFNIKKASDRMIILYDDKTKLFEQNEGFYRLPHIDINAIKREEFPLYSHWSYDRIYRGDMIKQPDVLMFLFLFISYFDKNVIKANYDFYEPKCIHESSLSPSIHSIIANYLGMKKQAIDFFGFASRLDLDNYNNNTSEGLHMTSISAAWMNIVYGFGGLRSDKEIISISPTIPDRWEEYSFHLNLSNSNLLVRVLKNKVIISNSAKPIEIMIYGKKVIIKDMYETNI